MSQQTIKKGISVEDFIEKMKIELEKDATIDRLNMGNDLRMVTSLQAKWLQYHSQFKMMYIKNYKELKALRAKKLMAMIQGKTGFTATNREANKLVDGDKDIVDLEEKIEKIEAIISFIDNAQKIVRDKGFTISNIIRLEEFEAGMG